METNKLQLEIDAFRKNVKFDSFLISIGELQSLYSEEELTFGNIELLTLDRSKAVEDALMGIQLPSIYVYVNPNGKWKIKQNGDHVFQLLRYMRAFEDAGVPAFAVESSFNFPSLVGKYWINDNPEISLTSQQRILIKRAKMTAITFFTEV